MADEHVCTQLSEIAFLKASTEQQGKDISEIKQELKELNTKVDKNHEEVNGELKLIRSDVSKIDASIAAQSVKIDNLADMMKESSGKLVNLHTKVEDLDDMVKTHTISIKHLSTATDDHEQRLDHVEKKLWKILAVIGAAIFILQLIGTMSSCSDIKHFVRQVIIEEEAVNK